jgi:hypothetical protein
MDEGSMANLMICDLFLGHQMLIIGQIADNPRLEVPARATGWTA